ncbi:hypothetical protein BC829DRAFT_390409 [Chytridium lagenaria]|nr:hypothetical protein BC829DRAFT_390409 [Chytridium lagenaria]
MEEFFDIIRSEDTVGLIRKDDGIFPVLGKGSRENSAQPAFSETTSAHHLTPSGAKVDLLSNDYHQYHDLDAIFPVLGKGSREASAQPLDSGVGVSDLPTSSKDPFFRNSHQDSDFFASLALRKLTLDDSPNAFDEIHSTGASNEDDVDRLVNSAVEDIRRKRESIKLFKSIPTESASPDLESIMDEEAPSLISLEDDDLYPPNIPVILTSSTKITSNPPSEGASTLRRSQTLSGFSTTTSIYGTHTTRPPFSLSTPGRQTPERKEIPTFSAGSKIASLSKRPSMPNLKLTPQKPTSLASFCSSSCSVRFKSKDPSFRDQI